MLVSFPPLYYSLDLQKTIVNRALSHPEERHEILGYQLDQLYLLPGRQPPFPPPSSNFGQQGDATEDCCVVLTRMS